MNTPISSVLVYLLGFVGIASIGLLPLRSWQELRNVFKGSKALIAFVALITAVVLWSNVQITMRIFKCLTETYCGPGVASGWTYLAMLGAVYLAFEAVIFIVQKIGRTKAIKPAV